MGLHRVFGPETIVPGDRAAAGGARSRRALGYQSASGGLCPRSGGGARSSWCSCSAQTDAHDAAGAAAGTIDQSAHPNARCTARRAGHSAGPDDPACSARPAPPFATFVSVSVALLSLIFELFLGNTTSSIARSPMGWCIR